MCVGKGVFVRVGAGVEVEPEKLEAIAASMNPPITKRVTVSAELLFSACTGSIVGVIA